MIPSYPCSPPFLRKRPQSLTASCASGVCVRVCTRRERVCDRFAMAWFQWALWVRRHCSTRSSSLCTSSRRRCSSSSRASRAALTWASTCSLALLADTYMESQERRRNIRGLLLFIDYAIDFPLHHNIIKFKAHDIQFAIIEGSEN